MDKYVNTLLYPDLFVNYKLKLNYFKYWYYRYMTIHNLVHLTSDIRHTVNIIQLLPR